MKYILLLCCHLTAEEQCDRPSSRSLWAWDVCSVAKTCRHSAAEVEQKTLCMLLTMFPRCELRPKQLATSWDCSTSVIWEYCRRDANTTGKWPLLSLTFFISWTSAGFSYTAEISSLLRSATWSVINALQRRDDNTMLIYIRLLPKPVGTTQGRPADQSISYWLQEVPIFSAEDFRDRARWIWL